MATYGKKLLDVNGNVILPKTRSSLVYMDNNETVEDTIKNILSEITKIKDGTTTTNASKILGEQASMANPAHNCFYLAATDTSGLNVKDGARSYYSSLFAKNDWSGRQIDTTYMPKSGGIFTGRVTFNGGASIAQDKSAGSGVFVQPIHIPNISQNVRFIILWT